MFKNILRTCSTKAHLSGGLNLLKVIFFENAKGVWRSFENTDTVFKLCSQQVDTISVVLSFIPARVEVDNVYETPSGRHGNSRLYTHQEAEKDYRGGPTSS